MKSISRMYRFAGKTIREKNGKLKSGQEYFTLTNAFGCPEIGVLLRWENGQLHSDTQPAVEFTDSHTEYWSHGWPHNKNIDTSGNRIPAIIGAYRSTMEWWEDGKQIANPNI